MIKNREATKRMQAVNLESIVWSTTNPIAPTSTAIAPLLSDMNTGEIAALEARHDKTCLLKQGMMQGWPDEPKIFSINHLE